MRTFGIAILSGFVFVVLCAPLAAQSNRPIYLFSLEINGAGSPPLHVFLVNPTTGALSEVSNSPFATGLGSCCIVVDPTGRFVYVANSNSKDITAYSVDASTGNLTRVPSSPFTTGGGLRAVGIDPTGRFLYVSSVDMISSLYAYSIDSGTGVLTPLAGSPFPQANATSSITFDPKGNFVFLAQVQQTNPVATLIDSVDFATGALVQVVGANTGADVTAMEPSGRFLYTINTRDTNSSLVSAFVLNPAQPSLSEIQGSPFAVAQNPILWDIAFDPSGKFLFLDSSGFSQQNGFVSAYTIDPQTGALAQVGLALPGGINPTSIVADPTGHFVYASSTTSTTATPGYATILSFAINGSTGELTPLSASPWMDTLQYSYGNRLAIAFGPIGTPNPVPTLSSLLPSSVTAGGAGFTLQVNGLNFVPGATVYFGGQARNATFVSTTQLNADILSSDIANGGTGVVFVFNPLPGGGASTSVEFTVFNPSPTISSINPTSAVAGAAGFTLTVNGSNFVTGSIVNFNGTARSTTFVSSTQLTIAISASDIASQGTISISVTDPPTGGSGGGTSSTLPLTILPTNTQPVVGALVPVSATAGGPAFTLKIVGTGFTSSSIVTFNSAPVSTAFVSATLLEAAIPASAIAVAGHPLVTVTNPGGSPSVVATFTVNNEDFNLSVTAPSISVVAGNPASYSLLVTPSNGTIANSVTFTVSGSPTGATPAFSPSATIPAGSGATTVMLSIATMAHSAVPPIKSPRVPLPQWPLVCLSIVAVVFMCLGACFLGGRGPRFAPQFLLASLLLIAAGFTACGGVTGPAGPAAPANLATGTPAGTYSIIVTATSGNGSLSTTVTLKVM